MHLCREKWDLLKKQERRCQETLDGKGGPEKPHPACDFVLPTIPPAHSRTLPPTGAHSFPAKLEDVEY